MGKHEREFRKSPGLLWARRVCVHPFPNLHFHALEHLPRRLLRDAAECRRLRVGSLQALNLHMKTRGREAEK